jgi:hypothetical protein
MDGHDPEVIQMRDLVPESLLSELTHDVPKPATAWIHSLFSTLTAFYPTLVDYARPICEKGAAYEVRAVMKAAEALDPEIIFTKGIQIEM